MKQYWLTSDAAGEHMINNASEQQRLRVTTNMSNNDYYGGFPTKFYSFLMISMVVILMLSLLGCGKNGQVMDGDTVTDDIATQDITTEDITTQDTITGDADHNASDNADHNASGDADHNASDNADHNASDNADHTTGKTASLSFESFDGGGPEFNVVIADESIVSYESRFKYHNDDHEKMNGSGYDVIITFTGIKPGETTVLIEERSPIADNLDHKYKATVDDELNVQIEQLSVKDINEEVSEELHIKINGVNYKTEWEDNESVQALKELCPLTVKMSMYGGFEQVGSLGQSLPRNDEQTTTDYGDIVLYSGDQIVIFYGSNSWSYTRLGHIHANKNVMEKILANGDVTIELTNE